MTSKPFIFFINVVKTHRLFLAIFILVLGIYAVEVFGNASVTKYRECLWDKVLEHYVAFGTFVVAFAAWFSNASREWKDKLPKRLSVYFIHNGKIVMQCQQAYLSGEADIRQMGQQIGAQISGGWLSFSIANVDWKEAPIIYAKQQGEHSEQIPTSAPEEQYPFRHYVVLYHLLSLPAGFDEDACYIWESPFDQIIKEEPKTALAETNEKQESSSCLFKPQPNKPRSRQFSRKEKIEGAPHFHSKKFWALVKTQGHCVNEDFAQKPKEQL